MTRYVRILNVPREVRILIPKEMLKLSVPREIRILVPGEVLKLSASGEARMLDLREVLKSVYLERSNTYSYRGVKICCNQIIFG